MKTLAILLTIITLVSAREYRWPKDTFTADQIKEAKEKAKTEKKSLAWIFINPGMDDKQEGADQTFTALDDLIRAAKRTCIIIHCIPNDIGAEKTQVPEKIASCVSGKQYIPILIISDDSGFKIWGHFDGKEVTEGTRDCVRTSIKNKESGTQMGFKSGDKDKDKKEAREDKKADKEAEEADRKAEAEAEARKKAQEKNKK